MGVVLGPTQLYVHALLSLHPVSMVFSVNGPKSHLVFKSIIIIFTNKFTY